IETMIDAKFKSLLGREYAHLRVPSLLYARVTRISGNEHDLQILDESKVADVRFPRISNVRSNSIFALGDIVVIGLLYGKLSRAYIIEKVT
ncbi:hypothetical protein JYT99_02710, partial [bacterium AH-315-E09]|nr:hypothetical protein [bacterium AH-315-E09]